MRHAISVIGVIPIIGTEIEVEAAVFTGLQVEAAIIIGLHVTKETEAATQVGLQPTTTDEAMMMLKAVTEAEAATTVGLHPTIVEEVMTEETDAAAEAGVQETDAAVKAGVRRARSTTTTTDAALHILAMLKARARAKVLRARARAKVLPLLWRP